MKLILASSSPRRAEILRHAAFSFEIRPTHVDESLRPGERPTDYVLRLAQAKSQAAAEDEIIFGEAAYVIGADTAVVVEGELLGKPAKTEDARRMLLRLRGKTHEVLTGLSILAIPEGKRVDHVETTRVTFLNISDQQVEEYISSGEPFDKAGAYGIQGIGGRFVERIEGCYFNVMGLPVSRLWGFLRGLGWSEPEISYLP
jgi:septum formation protein